MMLKIRMVMPMKKLCRKQPEQGPTSICIRLDCSMDKPMSLTRVFPAMMPLESDTTFWVMSNTAITISKVLLMSHTETSSLENPAHDEGRLKLCHVVVLGDHLDQFVAGDKGQDDACNGQHHVPG